MTIYNKDCIMSAFWVVIEREHCTKLKGKNHANKVSERKLYCIYTIIGVKELIIRFKYCSVTITI